MTLESVNNPRTRRIHFSIETTKISVFDSWRENARRERGSYPVTNSHHLPACSLLPDGFWGYIVRFNVFVSDCYMWHILTFYFQSFNKVHFCKRTPQIKPEHQLHFKQTPEARCCVLFKCSHCLVVFSDVMNSYQPLAKRTRKSTQVNASL